MLPSNYIISKSINEKCVFFSFKKQNFLKMIEFIQWKAAEPYQIQLNISLISPMCQFNQIKNVDPQKISQLIFIFHIFFLFAQISKNIPRSNHQKRCTVVAKVIVRVRCM